MRPKTPAEIKIMREGGKRLATILDYLSNSVEAGMSTKAISDLASKQVQKHQLRAVLYGYEMSGLRFPDIICVSVNDEVVHGIPSAKRIIQENDIVKIDLTVGYKGMIVDSARTVVVGNKIPDDIKRLVEGTKRALYAGIDAINGDGTRVGDIAYAIQEVLDKNKLGIVRDLVGHGVGYEVHEDPSIPNYGIKGTGPALHAGVTIAVEPMAMLGDWRIKVLPDGWTIATRDKSLSAHFEHTILVTEKGAEILTA